jgi:putrescine transport system ATP-binding protein
VRPEKLRMQAGFLPGNAVNVVSGCVVDIGYLGGTSIYKVRLNDGAVMKAAVANVTRTGDPVFSAGDEVWLSWPPEASVVLTA